MIKTLSIIIPVFNEEKTIKELLKKVNKVKLPRGISKEIVIVDDCSTDQTTKIIVEQKTIRYKYIKHQKNLGKGAAVRTGLTHSSGDIIIIQDGDLEYDPGDYVKLLQPVLENSALVVYGTRLKNYPLKFWGKDKTTLPTHLIANRFLTFLTNFLYGGRLSDMETGYKLFRKDVIKNFLIWSKGFDFEPEITAKILKLKIPIIEVPIKVRPRTYKEGKKIGWKDGLMAVWALIKYRIIN